MIDVRKLRMLAALDRLGTIAAVAEELHLTAPGVSMQLTALEQELGIALTERRGRRVVLTAAGRSLAAHGREILDRILLAEYELDALRVGAVGHYTITAFPSAARTLLADTCRRLISDGASSLHVEFTTREPEGSLEGLIRGDVDLAVIHSYSNLPRDIPDGVTSWALGSERVRLAVPESGGCFSTRLADYADHAWVTPTEEVTCFHMIDRACGLAGFRPRIVARSMDFSVQLAFVAAGAGVALVPELTIATLPDGVRLIDLDAPVQRHLFLAARTASAADPGIRALAARIAEVAAERLAIPST